MIAIFGLGMLIGSALFSLIGAVRGVIEETEQAERAAQ